MIRGLLLDPHTRFRVLGGRPTPQCFEMWYKTYLDGPTVGGSARRGTGERAQDVPRRICAWCMLDMGKAPEGTRGDTHGICVPCSTEVFYEEAIDDD